MNLCGLLLLLLSVGSGLMNALVCFFSAAKERGGKEKDVEMGEAWGSDEPENETYELGLLDSIYVTTEMATELGLNEIKKICFPCSSHSHGFSDLERMVPTAQFIYIFYRLLNFLVFRVL